jgi:hypothetical protein
MIKDQEFFTTLSQVSGKVILGDGKTSLSIQGVGTVKCIKGSHELILENVRYVPSLSESIYSLFLHIQHPGNEIHSLFEQGLFLTLPEFESQAIIGRDDLYLDAHPLFYQLAPHHRVRVFPSIQSVIVLRIFRIVYFRKWITRIVYYPAFVNVILP